MHNQPRAVALALIAVGLWSTVATAFKLTLQYINVIELLLLSSGVSCVILWAMGVARYGLAMVFAGQLNLYIKSAVLGCINPFLYYLVLFKAYDLLPAQQAQALNYTWVLMLSILAVPLLKQALRAIDIGGLLLGYAGVVVVCTQGNLLPLEINNTPGIVFALLSTVFWSVYWIYNVLDERPPVIGLLWNFSFSLIPMLIVYWVFTPVRMPAWQGLFGAVYIGAIEMSITFVIWLTALKNARSAAGLSMLIFMSPFLSLLWIATILGENIAMSTLLGLAMIVIAIVVQFKLKAKA